MKQCIIRRHYVKKILITIFLSVLLFSLVNTIFRYFNSIEYYQKHILKINISNKTKVVYKRFRDASFLGDGTDIIVYELNDKELKKIKNNNAWNYYEDILDKFVKRYCSENELNNFSFPDNGYYLLYDKQDKNFKTIENYQNSDTISYNFILSILDFNNKHLIYLETDS